MQKLNLAAEFYEEDIHGTLCSLLNNWVVFLWYCFQMLMVIYWIFLIESPCDRETSLNLLQGRETTSHPIRRCAVRFFWCWSSCFVWRFSCNSEILELTLLILRIFLRGVKLYTVYQPSTLTLEFKINRVVRVKLNRTRSVSTVHRNERSWMFSS